VANVNTNSPVRIQTLMRRGVIAMLVAAGTFGAALAWSPLAVATGHPQWPATAQVTPAPSPDNNDDYCKQDPYWYLCQHYHPEADVASPR